MGDIDSGKLVNYQPAVVAEKIVQFCRSNDKKLIIISGNGGSGKTELSKIIAQEAEKHGHANLLEMDDFVVDTELRNSARIVWNDAEKGERTGRYTTAIAASHFLPSIKAILNNIEKGNNYHHWPKKAVDAAECRLLHGDAIVTIVEGIGTVFLERSERNSVSIFLECSKEIEIARRIQRGKFSNEQSEEEVREKFEERNSQYKAFIEPHRKEHGLVLESAEDFSLNVIRDDYRIL